MVCGWFGVFGLSLWSPSSSGWRICGSCIVLSSVVSGMSVVKSFTGVFSKVQADYLPPFVFCSS